MTTNQDKQQKLQEIEAALARAERVLIVAHVDPDGDTIGSALGLAWALRERGHEVVLACQDPVPSDIRFLPGADEFGSQIVEADLVISVDTSDIRRMGSLYDPKRFSSLPLVVIDHHTTNTGFGDINLVRDAAATVQLVVELLDHLDILLDEAIATCLLTGLITDTQGFRTSSTTAEALAVAQRLVDAGAPLADITNKVFNQRSFHSLALWGDALSRARLDEGVIWTALYHSPDGDDPEQAGFGSGLVNFLNTVQQARAAVVFREQGDGTIDVSMRAKPGVDVSQVALAFGGGGHPQAAGCQVHGEMEQVRDGILAALHPVVEDQMHAGGKSQ